MLGHSTLFRSPIPFLLLLWLAASAFNMSKAVHIDDTAYLAMSKAVAAHPGHPMSVPFNWGSTGEPIHVINQPLLWPALLAAAGALFGQSEFVFHALLAGFTLAAIIFFYRLARQLSPPHAQWLTAAFALGPALIPSQNLMCDVPLLALWLVFFWAILCPAPASRMGQRYALAAVVVAAACLVKYLSLVLLPILCLAIVLRKQWRALWTLALPLVVLGGWSLFNFMDYGGIHLLERQGSSHLAALPSRVLDWLACLGAVAPFAILGVPYLLACLWGRRALAACGVAGALSFLWSFFGWGDSEVDCLLRACFLANGLLVTMLSGGCIAQDAARKGTGHDEARYGAAILGAWMVATALFIVLFSPFLAVRHVLPVTAPVLLLLGRHVAGAVPAGWRLSGLALTIALGCALGLSDWQYAQVYREQAGAIRRALPSQPTVWYAGHWSWQWYAQQAGMKQYDVQSSTLQQGDFLVAPNVIGTLGLAARHAALLEETSAITVDHGAGTLLRTMTQSGGFYSGGYRVLPWTISRQPLERFSIFKIKKAQ